MIKVTVKQSDLILTGSTAQMFADRLNRCLDVRKTNPSKGVITYYFDEIPQELFSNDEFMQILQDDAFELEGVILYAVCTPGTLDVVTPDNFPSSLIPEVRDEDEVISTARQATMGEYFPRSSKVGEVEVIELHSRDMSKGIGGKSNSVTYDHTPDRLAILTYIGALSPRFAHPEVLTRAGKDEYISVLNIEL